MLLEILKEYRNYLFHRRGLTFCFSFFGNTGGGGGAGSRPCGIG
jgi:hypothetical protein